MKILTVCLVLITGLCLCACLPVSAAGEETIDLSSLMITLNPTESPSESGSVAAASVNDNYPISVDQAKNNIRVFTGNLDIDPVLAGTGTMPIGNYYYFAVNNSFYYVNQNSGVVEFALMTQNIPDTGVLSLSRDQAYEMGKEFARSKYDSFDQKNWKIVAEQQYNTSWYRMNGTEREYYSVPLFLFTLREEQQHVLTPSTVNLYVNAVDGKVIYYSGVDRLLLVDLTPSITLGRAVEVAGEHFEYETTHSTAYLSVITRPMNVQSLAWIVTLRGTHGDHEHEENFVIDAVSGEYISRYYDNIWPEGYSNY